jgi:hypothetical protein
METAITANERTGDEQSTRMDGTEQTLSPETLAALRRFARARPAVERCELCGATLADEHPHLLNIQSRQITCACDACAILFCGQEGGKFLRVPRRVLRLDGFAFTALEWEGMMLPINLAFFLRQPGGEVTAMYPSPAGAMESLIELPSWDELFGREAALAAVQPEVEALLVNRIGDQAAYFVVPVDACYRLIGLIRTKWRGLSGGAEVWQGVADFFASLERQATPVGGGGHA